MHHPLNEQCSPIGALSTVATTRHSSSKRLLLPASEVKPNHRGSLSWKLDPSPTLKALDPTKLRRQSPSGPRVNVNCRPHCKVPLQKTLNCRRLRRACHDTYTTSSLEFLFSRHRPLFPQQLNPALPSPTTQCAPHKKKGIPHTNRHGREPANRQPPPSQRPPRTGANVHLHSSRCHEAQGKAPLRRTQPEYINPPTSPFHSPFHPPLFVLHPPSHAVSSMPGRIRLQIPTIIPPSRHPTCKTYPPSHITSSQPYLADPYLADPAMMMRPGEPCQRKASSSLTTHAHAHTQL